MLGRPLDAGTSTVDQKRCIPSVALIQGLAAFTPHSIHPPKHLQDIDTLLDETQKIALRL